MSAHRISEFAVHLVSIPARETHSHGSGDVSRINSVLLQLTTDTGLTGWGEASPWPVFTGTAEASAAALHIHIRPHVIGADPVQVEPAMNRIECILRGHPEAKCAVETALLDLAGQIAGLSIAEMVGGRQRETVPLSFSVANRDFARDRHLIESLWEDGVRLYKLKAGFDQHHFDLMRLESLRKLYGDEIDLRVDYNQGLPAYDAIRRIRDLEQFRPTFVEQPVKREEWAALAEITRAVDTPIMADESVFNPEEAFRAATDRIADIFSLKINKAGGIRRCLEVAAIAKSAGIEVYGGCMFETSIAHAAGAHLMAALPAIDLGCEFYMSSYYAEIDLADFAFPAKGGFVHVPGAPGLGIRPDPDKLAFHRSDLLT
ncbi:MAG: cycloisomerase [Rhodobacteraceae bacterium]|nr:cycloisomerase [Paracoccaceae bacterium]